MIILEIVCFIHSLSMTENSVVAQFKDLLHQAIINADVVKIFDYLLTIAVEEDASDIHIEPFENYCRIRTRVDGILSELVQYPKNLHESVISKFKIESGQMRPDEKRLPQDARVSTVTQTNKEIDLRASTLPTVWGEKLVMRIVDKSKKMQGLGDLGIEWINKEIIYQKINDPNGIILNTWPTGSGKTSTLYAALSRINKVEFNITTFEDPVENKVQWLNQSQIRSDINFTFASGLRSALRQDPDIIMVWEIRDHETLEMAMEAAMTGHLVFSTVHTNSAAETITRILNLGAQPYMMAGTINMVMAQRLARKICPQCKSQKSVKWTSLHNYAVAAFKGMNMTSLQKELERRNISIQRWNQFVNEGLVSYWTGHTHEDHQGDGDDHTCSLCKWSGYKGRLGVFEVMDYSDEIKNMLIQGKTAYEIENVALEQWMINLERDAILKVVADELTLEEVYRVVKHKVL